MDRIERIKKYISRQQKGLEIGAYFNPMAPKRDGYNCLVFDIFDAERLRKNLLNDPQINNTRLNDIEDVDIVGSSTEIFDSVKKIGGLGTFDYIISSHNFEHLPNPIKFLQGCQKVLKRGGMLSMAIPDKRTCFDYFRPLSTLGEWLSAYKQDRRFPTDEQVFDGNIYFCSRQANGKTFESFSQEEDPGSISTSRDIKKYYELFMSADNENQKEYKDAHCWTFTESSFLLLILETNYLELTDFSIKEISHDIHSNEFIIHLENSPSEKIKSEDFSHLRTELLHKIANECAYNTKYSYLLRTINSYIPKLSSEILSKSVEISPKIDILSEKFSIVETKLANVEYALTTK